jgi:expansin (peptidoglycan-binding protein)
MRRGLVFLLGWCLSCGGSLPVGGDARSIGDAPPLGEEQPGIATYYDFASGDGACMFGPSPDDLDVAAMNAEQWAGSRVCGACARVTGPAGQVVVRIVDLCPECRRGHLDLSPQAFARIAALAQGRVDITWRLQACDVSGNLRYQLKDGSSQWWTAIQVRNHRRPIESLAYQKDGAWVDLPRSDYNHFVAEGGTGTGPIRVRATSWDGQALEDVLPGPDAGTLHEGQSQFQ